MDAYGAMDGSHKFKNAESMEIENLSNMNPMKIEMLTLWITFLGSNAVFSSTAHPSSPRISTAFTWAACGLQQDSGEEEERV